MRFSYEAKQIYGNNLFSVFGIDQNKGKAIANNVIGYNFMIWCFLKTIDIVR